MKLRGVDKEPYTPDPFFFSMMSNLQMEVQSQKHTNEALSNLLDQSAEATLVFRDSIATEFKKDPLNTDEIAELVGKLDWTFKLISVIDDNFEEEKQ